LADNSAASEWQTLRFGDTRITFLSLEGGNRRLGENVNRA